LPLKDEILYMLYVQKLSAENRTLTAQHARRQRSLSVERMETDGCGHAAELKESDRKRQTLPDPTSVRECLLPAVALKQNLQTKLYLSIVG
jgi:hypothetical protein